MDQINKLVLNSRIRPLPVYCLLTVNKVLISLMGGVG